MSFTIIDIYINFLKIEEGIESRKMRSVGRSFTAMRFFLPLILSGILSGKVRIDTN